MTATCIKDLFANDVSREIEEIIKVDQADERIVRDELSEYVVTDALRSHFDTIFERYAETPNKPHEGIGVWVSGFFGSGKSSFAKYLGLGLENRVLVGEPAGEILGQRINEPRAQVLLKNIAEHIPTDAVIFDVSTDRGIRAGNQSLTEIMYRLFLQHLGYARDLDLSELEITLEADGRLDEFTAKYHEVYDKGWDTEKGKIAVAVQQASRVMHELDPETYPTADSWKQSAMRRADVSAGLLADRCKELMARRRPDKTLVFVVDEVGQFVARDVQKMLDLQAVVQSLGRVGRGKMWLVVTSQEKLTELVGGLDDRRVELARLMDRFPLQVHLEPADISEVTSKRVLAKTAAAQVQLSELYEQHSGRLLDSTRLTADIRLPELTRSAFVDLYPLLPYQVDLIIQLVSGLRTQSGASKHVGGAARTIIKLAQQLLIHPDVDLGAKSVGALATLDQVYDLVAGNVSSEVRGKIDEIGRKVDHPMAQPVAEAVCLLQYVRSVHCTAENIAASLFPAVDADSRLSEVKDALAALVAASMIRQGDQGYRIPTPAEDDWERQRAALSPKPSDANRIYAEQLDAFWKPHPSHVLLGVKLFKAGLFLQGHSIADGDVPFHVTLINLGEDLTASSEVERQRSRTEKESVFWVAALNDSIDREMAELFRSKEILSRRERGAQTKDETALVYEEQQRRDRHRDELRRLMKQALLSGSVYFRGNDRSPDASDGEVGRAAAKVLSQALPEVFSRFDEAATKVTAKDLEILLTAENLLSPPPALMALRLVHDEAGSPAIDVESGPLAELLARIENRTSYGEVATGRYLADELAKEPFGWEFDVVRILVACLLRAGAIEMTSRGQVVRSARALEARDALTNNSVFRQASFRPSIAEGIDVIDTYGRFKEVFGKELAELAAGPVAQAIRSEVSAAESQVTEAATTLRGDGLPGADLLDSALEQMRPIRGGDDEQTLKGFMAAYRGIGDAIRRAAELEQALTPSALQSLRMAQGARSQLWPTLAAEPDLSAEVADHAIALDRLMSEEVFYRDLLSIDQHAVVIRDEYERRHAESASERARRYADALEQLRSTRGWETLDSEKACHIEEPLAARATVDGTEKVSIPMLREQTNACETLLKKATEEALHLIDGGRIVPVDVRSFFSGGIETEEQLQAALDGLKQYVLELIAEGKRALIQ